MMLREVLLLLRYKNEQHVNGNKTGERGQRCRSRELIGSTLAGGRVVTVHS